MTTLSKLQQEVIEKFKKNYVVKRPNSEEMVLGKLFGDSILCWTPENLEQFILNTIEESYKSGREEILLFADHLTTLRDGTHDIRKEARKFIKVLSSLKEK